MRRMRGLGRGGRLLIALAVGGMLFGIATAVQAAIPDSHGVIHGCYGKSGTPSKGQLRVRDASQGEQCRSYENPLDWNATGEAGATGPTGPVGPTGPSDAYDSGIFGGVGLPPNGSWITVAYLDLPAGNFAITARVGAEDSLATVGVRVDCKLTTPSAPDIDHSTVTLLPLPPAGPGTQRITIPLAAAAPLASPGAVSIRCFTPTLGAVAPGTFDNKIVAVKVADLHL